MKTKINSGIQKKIIEEYGNKLRVRVCGLCIESGNVLLVNHHSLNKGGDFWGPPGGGMDFGLSAEENLKREFYEETGLTIEIEKFLFVHEYLSPPLHAIELIFKVRRLKGRLTIGYDPEMAKDEQIIKNVKFMDFSKLKELDESNVHQLFLVVKNLNDIEKLKGYVLWKNDEIS